MSKISSCPGGPHLKCGIIYLHSMASQISRMDERFIKYLNPFVNYAIHVVINLPACCWCRLLRGMMVVSVASGTTEMYEKTLELEEQFQKAASSAIHLIPYSVRLDGSHDRVSKSVAPNP